MKIETLATNGEFGDKEIEVQRRGKILGFFISQTNEFIAENSDNWMRGMEDQKMVELWEEALDTKTLATNGGSGMTVDSRRRDPKSIMVVKYENSAGVPIAHKPVRKINPDIEKLSPVAKFIVENCANYYVGGFNLRGISVRVEGPIGSQWEIEVKNNGVTRAIELARIWGWDKNERSCIRGWLFPVFEPDMDETKYFNDEADRIIRIAGNGGRIIINGKIIEIVSK